MQRIIAFLKFGERRYLERMQQGNLYFSNAQTLRAFEMQHAIKGQGDRLEGGTELIANQIKLAKGDASVLLPPMKNGAIPLYFEPADLLPVFCVFACFEKDSMEKEDGSIFIRLSHEIRENISSHFPKADTVAIIKEPERFVKDVRSSVGEGCISDLVKYYDLTGIQSEYGPVNSLDYFKYLMQDVPPLKKDGKNTYSFQSQYVFRSLLCKDVFFDKEQEYRFILTKKQIAEPREFPIRLSASIELQDLSRFFTDMS